MIRNKKHRSLSRDPHHRLATLRSLVQALVREEKIVTTPAKAKELRSYIDRVITHAKRGTNGSMAKMQSMVDDREVEKKILGELVGRYETRPSGFTRIIRLEPRAGDGAKQVIIELV